MFSAARRAVALVAIYVATSNALSTQPAARPSRSRAVRVGSQRIDMSAPGKYYYAHGSRDALSQELEEHRIGGEGRVHVFRFPSAAPASVINGISHTRRSSVSSLVQMSTESTISTRFPKYEVPASYSNPLSAADQGHEKTAANMITSGVVQENMEEITAFPTRSYSNVAESDKVEKFLQKRFDDMGLTTCIHKFDQYGRELANVVAFKKGEGEGSVTVGAHYDSRPFTGKAPGADDNGSGVAALMAVAKAYMSSNVKSTKSVYFVGFGGEEDGLDGSAAFTNALFESGLPSACTAPAGSLMGGGGKRVESMDSHRAIVLDEVGWRSPAYAKATLNMESYDWADEVLNHVASASASLNGDALEVVHSNNPFGSDHMSFLDKMVPAALMINADDEAYPNYHKSSDTIENVSPEYVAMIAKASMGGLMRLAA